MFAIARPVEEIFLTNSSRDAWGVPVVEGEHNMTKEKAGFFKVALIPLIIHLKNVNLKRRDRGAKVC